MLRIYSDVRTMQTEARAICAAILRHDRELAGQLRRSAQSVALNLAEGMAARDGNRRKAYETALREAQECVAAVDTAQLWGYVGDQAAAVDRMDKIVRTLMRLTMPRA